jgi:hypothetical protein
VALRGNVGGKPVDRRSAPGAGTAEIAVLHPELAALELQHRYRERRGSPVRTCRRAEPALRLVRLPALAVDPGESCQRAEVSMTVNGQPADRERLVVASERLIDRGALRIEVGAVAPQGGGGVEVGQGRPEPVKDAPHPGARREGPGVARHLADEVVGQRRGPLGVGNAAQHVAPQRE